VTIRDQLQAAWRRDGRAAVDICEEAGVGRRTFFNALRGLPVRSENLFALCAVLGIDVLQVPRRNLHSETSVVSHTLKTW
jgi:hypothetical protein